MAAVTRRYSTGLTFLDRRIDGGVPSGSVVALVADPSSQSELLLQVLGRARRLYHLSTVCPDDAERRDLFDPHQSRGDLTLEYASPEKLFEDPEQYLYWVPPESFVILDPVNPLERVGGSTYLDFLNDLKGHLRAEDSVAFLHCLGDRDGPERTMTLKRADQVWQLRTTASPNEIRNRLYVTKSRGQRALTEPIPLVLTDRVVVDTSRNIG